MESKASDVIVVGGGLGGLASAALLARKGLRVRVLEKASHPGGRARSRVQDGFVLNQGAHALYRGGRGTKLLRELGIVPSGRKIAGGGSFVEHGERLYALPRGPGSLLFNDYLGARGKLEFLQLMATLGERKARALGERSLRQWLDEDFRDARTRTMLEMFVRLTSVAHAPELLPASAAVRQLARAVRHGVMYLDGGWQSMLDQLSERVREAGAAIELNADVQRIEHQRGAVSAVHMADGRRHAARAVIAALPPAALAKLLQEDILARRWADASVPLRAACLDLGVPELPYPRRYNVQSLDAPLYYADHTAYAKLAPEGGHVLHLIRYLAPGETGRDSEAELHAFLERIQPGVYQRARVKRFLPDMIVHNDLPDPGRARSEHPEIAGLFFAGDFASPNAMLADAVFDSARTAATRAAEYCASRPVARALATSEAGCAG